MKQKLNENLLKVFQFIDPRKIINVHDAVDILSPTDSDQIEIKQLNLELPSQEVRQRCHEFLWREL